MGTHFLVAVLVLGYVQPIQGFAFPVPSYITSRISQGRNCVAAFNQANSLGLPYGLRAMSNKPLQLRMSEEPAAVKEQCDGPAKEGEIGNVDVSAAKVKIDEEIPTEGVIQLSDNAKKQLVSLRKSRGDAELVLRVGVRSGGCR